MSDKATGKGFFAVDRNMLNRMFEELAHPDPVYAYLVIANYTQGGTHSMAHQLTKAGAYAVSRKIGLSRRKSEQAISWLVENGYIREVGDGYRYLLKLSPEPEWIYLSHALIEGLGKSAKHDQRPLQRLHENLSIHKGITVKQARLDALQLLLEAYFKLSILDFFGISPHFIHEPWGASDGESSYTQFGAHILTNIDAESGPVTHYSQMPPERFWHGIDNLRKLGFLYRVLTVWDANPLTDQLAEPLYLLYRFKRSDTQPLAHLINRALTVFKVEIGDINTIDFGEHLTDNGHTGCFWQFGPGVPIVVYRPEFMPSTAEVMEGIALEIRRRETIEFAIREVLECECEIA